MIDLNQLKVSLTKNGCFKVAEVLKAYSRWEVLDHVEGRHEGIDVKRSQIANMLDMNPATDEIPAFWDDIRHHGNQSIDAFTLVAMLFSHEKVIRLMVEASRNQPEYTGYFLRKDLSNKEYTNLAYAFGCFGISDYRPGQSTVEYDLVPAIYHLREHGKLVQELLTSKLKRAGWKDPRGNRLSTDGSLFEELQKHRFHRVLSMEWERFEQWLNGHLDMEPVLTRFGLREVGLFKSPFVQAETIGARE